MNPDGDHGSETESGEEDDSLDAARRFASIRRQAIFYFGVGGLSVLVAVLLLYVVPIEQFGLRFLSILPLLLVGFGLLIFGTLRCRCPACGAFFGVTLPPWTIDRMDHCPNCGVNLSLH